MRSAPTAAERALALALLVVVLAGLALAVAGRRLPEPLGPDAPPELFSAGPARALLERIAERPHPVGSTDHGRVRLLLLAELERLGLAPELESGVERDVQLTNIVARVPGRASTGTVLCLAHYDSVPTGPGAG